MKIAAVCVFLAATAAFVSVLVASALHSTGFHGIVAKKP